MHLVPFKKAQREKETANPRLCKSFAAEIRNLVIDLTELKHFIPLFPLSLFLPLIPCLPPAALSSLPLLSFSVRVTGTTICFQCPGDGQSCSLWPQGSEW